MIAIANPIKEEYKPVQNTSDIDIDILSQDIISMTPLNPAYFEDIRTILLNRMPHLSEDDIDILIDIFLCTH